MSSYGVKLRKVGVADYDTQIKEVRNQLAEQLRAFDSHLEQKTQVLQDLSDYLRRRGEIEGEYARSLDKLADRFSSKIKKKESSSDSVVYCWQELLTQTRQESKDHIMLSESCGTVLPQQLSRCLEHVQRLAKKSKDICSQLQEGLMSAMGELQTTLKTYTQYHTEYLSAETKLKEAAKLEEKQKQSAVKKMERLMEKRQCKVHETQVKSTKARNYFLLDLEAANAYINKYYVHDLSTLIDFSDTGFHHCLSQVFRFYQSSRLRAHQNLGSGLQQLESTISGLDQGQDRDALMQAHNVAFRMPVRFQYQPHESDQVCEVIVDCETKSEIYTRFQQLQTRLSTVTAENEESSKTLQACHAALLDWIVEDVFGSAPEHTPGQSLDTPSENTTNKVHQTKRRSSLQDSETAYFLNIKDHLLKCSLISKLKAKQELLNVAIQKAGAVDGEQQSTRRMKRSVLQRKSQISAQSDYKPFSGDMLSYIQASGEPIPLVVESCIRFINFRGLHHEGIFRISGSQLEVNRLRDLFEKGEDPLEDGVCDMDSVASVLKLYFRGMENPLFPKESFDRLMECGRKEDEAKKVAQLKSIILSYPSPVIVVMRYLFAFLHHISQYSDENMMQPYNLAVCFGPSLIKAPEDADASALLHINAIVKTIIIQQENIFPSQTELEGPVYETCMTLDTEDVDTAIEESEVESEVSPNKVKDELEGVALFDYTARSASELSFRQGGRLRLYSRASSDWWMGEINGAKGLIPSKYIKVPSVDGGLDFKDADKSSTGESQMEEQTVRPDHTRPKELSVTQAVGSKIALQIPQGKHILPAISPRALRKPIDPQMRRSAEEETKISVDKDVCVQMDSVFKELLIRQQNLKNC